MDPAQNIEIAKIFLTLFVSMTTINTATIALISTVVEKIFQADSLRNSRVAGFLFLGSLLSLFASLGFSLLSLVNLPEHLVQMLISPGSSGLWVESTNANGTFIAYGAGILFFCMLTTFVLFSRRSAGAKLKTGTKAILKRAAAPRKKVKSSSRARRGANV